MLLDFLPGKGLARGVGKIGTWVALEGESWAGKSSGGGQTRAGDTLKATMAGTHS